MGCDRLPTEWTIERSPGAIEAEWRALEARGVGTPFQSYGWVANYHRDPDPASLFVTGRRNGKLEIVIPLSLRNGVLTWFGETLGNYHMPLVAADLFAILTPEDAGAIWREVHKLTNHPAATILRRQPALVAGRANPFAQWSSVIEPTLAYALTLGSDWASFYTSMHSAATRKTQRKKGHALARMGELAAGRIEGRDAVFEHAQLMLKWKSDQIEACGGRNNFAAAGKRDILARYAADNPDRAAIYAMSVNDTPIALAYAMSAGSELLLYQMAYAPGPTARYSPGRLLLNHIIKTAIADKRAVLDFSVGDEPYKKEVADRTTRLATSLAVHTAAGHASVLRERAKLAAKRMLKSSPVLLESALGVHAALRKIGR